MYTVTFYSFKGGVGRTMALVNVAAELVRQGRKVLVVDFDLEAPGLNTFDLVRPSPKTPGVVDYVGQYLETNRAPEVAEFVYRCPMDSAEGGQLWIMPTGRDDAFYASRLNGINWQRLYADHDGYLLFEDLKAQWKRALEPDYVLVDSRTGHTDVGGICTRHLPDAVVALFFPNEQNLQGLETVVKQIRLEAKGPREKKIQLHFVTSNIPDLDDEDQILASRMERFRERLEYTSLASTIHHYDSLALLNQVVFAVERPRSRLAQEYRDLAKSISRENLEDREGALDYLEKIAPRTLRIAVESPAADLEERLRKIREAHSRDGKVLYQVGRIFKDLGNAEEAITLFNQAVENGYREAGMMLDRAQLQRIRGNNQAVIADVHAALDSADSTYFGVSSAIRLLLELDPAGLGSLPEAPAFRSLSDRERFLVSRDLLLRREALPTAERILKGLLLTPSGELEHEAVAGQLVLCLIGEGRFGEAMRVISSAGTRPDPESLSVQDAFNYAMAEWAQTGTRPRDMFERVVRLDRVTPLRESANNLLCGAIAYWAVGDAQAALERASDAREHLRRTQRPDFSPWRYLTVQPRELREDIMATIEMIRGQGKLPAFMPPANRPSEHTTIN